MIIIGFVLIIMIDLMLVFFGMGFLFFGSKYWSVIVFKLLGVIGIDWCYVSVFCRVSCFLVWFL